MDHRASRASLKKSVPVFEEDIEAIYTSLLRWPTSNGWSEKLQEEDLIANFIDQDAATLKSIDTIGQDIASLSQRIIKEAGADGSTSVFAFKMRGVNKKFKTLLHRVNSMS